MGHASPAVRQARWGQKPDGVCLVVGACCRGFPPDRNTTGDVIFTNTHSQPPAAKHGKNHNLGGVGGSSSNSSSDSGSSSSSLGGIEAVHNTQYFWEAFPAGSGPGDRTTYMFTYLDAQVTTLLHVLNLLQNQLPWQGLLCPPATWAVGISPDSKMLRKNRVRPWRNWPPIAHGWDGVPDLPLSPLTLHAPPCPLQPSRSSLESLMDDYWRLMPQYQGVALEELQVPAHLPQIQQVSLCPTSGLTLCWLSRSTTLSLGARGTPFHRRIL
jgi:hypothetical protein